jgi:hypothetical protein
MFVIEQNYLGVEWTMSRYLRETSLEYAFITSSSPDDAEYYPLGPCGPVSNASRLPAAVRSAMLTALAWHCSGERDNWDLSDVEPKKGDFFDR